jgi:transcriptional regulator with PAS, ATPase and Fis domain
VLVTYRGSIGMHRAVLHASMTHELSISGRPSVSGPIGSHRASPGRSSSDAQLFEAMVQGASEGLVLLSADSLVLHANRAAVEMIGGDHNAIIGRPIHEVFFKDSSEASSIGEVLSTNLVVTRAHELADGRSILIVARPVVAGAARVLLTLCDISAIKQLMNRAQSARRAPNRTWAEMRGTEVTAIDGALIVTKSAVMQNVRDRALQCAAVDSPVLLLGETGTGKGVFARLIHEASARRSGPFYVLNCGAIPEGLLEAELFGYARGAFTGADPRGKVGLIELAHTGTLLLDEVGDIPRSLQVKLLRFLEAGEVWPVGASKAKRPDVRIVAATNCDLRQMITDGAFRRDLYYRLHVLSICIPPLRDRREDIPWLVAMMLDQLELKLGRRKRIAPQALDEICRLPLPGNVRELWNLIESLTVTASADTIQTTDLPGHTSGTPAASGAGFVKPEAGNLRETLGKVEAQILRETLQRYGTQSKAARHLGVAQATIARKTKRYGL